MDIEKLYALYMEHSVITTDSRDCPPGSIFFALKGDSFNGNAFASMAIEKGCSYAVIDEAEYLADGDERYILVDNVLQVLQDLARYHRSKFDIPVIQITGTNGKTTTKELVATVLGKKHNVLFTQGNFNNHIGVPKTLLRLRPEHTIAVIETGANHPGEIKLLTDIVDPDFGLITNVGKAHLEGFGSFEGVINTKCELYDYLRTKHATVFIHNDNKILKERAHGLHHIAYGAPTEERIAVEGEVIECAPYLKFRWHSADGQWIEVQTKLIGAYNLPNMLAAAAVGRTFGVNDEEISEALSNYVPNNNRSQLTQTECNSLVVDAYNANPTSMRAAIENFHDMNVDKKMAIIGEMKELGEASHKEHQKIVDLLIEGGFHHVWLVGNEFKSTSHPFRTFDDVQQVIDALKIKKPNGYYILIKGSNGNKLYLLPEYL